VFHAEDGARSRISETRAQIRRYSYVEHWKVGTIASELGVHPDAVRNAIESERFHNSKPLGYMRVKQVSDRIGMSEDWVRRFFGEIEGVRKVKSPGETLQTSLYNSADSYGNCRA
jgi:hypothetical protein